MDDRTVSLARRRFLQASAVIGASSSTPGLMPPVWAAGSNAPEMTTVRVDFIPLTDCTSLVTATLKGFDKKYGITLAPIKEASWAVVCSKPASGELDVAHVLYGLLYGLELGIASKAQPMTNLMTLDQNGQVITLPVTPLEQGIINVSVLKKWIVLQTPRTYTFAHTSPTDTHATRLYYWLTNADINPFTDVRTVVASPPQMVVNMRIGNMNGFCVGEPWSARVTNDRIGFTATTSQGIWLDHPEKIFGTRREWVEKYPYTVRALVNALLEASRWIDASEVNKRETAQILARRARFNTKESYLTAGIPSEYDNGIDRCWQDPYTIRFFRDGEVSFPWHSDGMWSLTQFCRWGLLKQQPDYVAIAARINRTGIWCDVAAAVGGIAPPAKLPRISTLMDGPVWDGRDPEAYASSFILHHTGA